MTPIERELQARQLERMKVGEILVYCWGYEQTNVDFYQIVGRTPKGVRLREIAREEVPGSTYAHGMACMVRPLKNYFLDLQSPPLTKRVGPYGISMPHGLATLVKGRESFYCSWYA